MPRPVLLAIVTAVGLCGSVWADKITYLSEEGERIVSEGRFIGSTRGFQAFERRDGQILILPNAAIESREPGDGPPPVDAPGMVEHLQQQFGADLLRTQIKPPFVVALVLSMPLDRTAETRATGFLRKAATFMSNVDSIFLRYARMAHFPLREPTHPLVLLIFESDDDFNRYAADVTGGRGLSAESMLGFYSGLSNWLAVRMSACDTFEVPLHEAIHQQMYNRVLQRFAPIPKWFDEGIAAGFEGSGDRVDVYPARVNSRYARQAQRLSGTIDWQAVVANDTAFTADVLAGEAYTLAWCMHWMLCTQHKGRYEAYVRELSLREPFATLEEAERVERFEQIFGVSVAELQADFPRVLQSHVTRQKIDLKDDRRPGRAQHQQGLGIVEVEAVQAPGQPLKVQGGLKNLSPLRTMSFYVTVEASGGAYADWTVFDLRPGQSRPLPVQAAVKNSGGSGTPPGTFRVFVRSTPANSEAAAAWKAGQLPGPVLRD